MSEPVKNPFYSPELEKAFNDLKVSVAKTPEAKAFVRSLRWLNRKLER